MEEENNDDGHRRSKRPATLTVKQKLNKENLSQSLWLVKVPTYVAERWMSAKHDEIVGSLMIGMKAAPTNNAPPVKQLIVKLETDKSGSVSENAPDVFTLDDRLNNDDSLFAFNIDNNTKQFNVEGKVTKSLAMRPMKNDNYHKLVKERTLQKLASRKEVKIVDVEETAKAANQVTTVEFLTSVRGDLKRKSGAQSESSTDGKSGVDIKALKNKMFEAFDKSEKQPFDAILTICSQVPSFTKEQDLRDLLEKYARYHSKGPYKHLWELKAEYKAYGGGLEDEQEIDESPSDITNSGSSSSGYNPFNSKKL